MKTEPIFLIRPAEPADLTAINRIYNHYVRHSTCTYQESMESMPERRRWFDAHDRRRYPILAAEGRSGEILAWGSIMPFRPRSAYRFAVEDSIYVHPKWQGKGIGSAMLGELINRAREQGFHTIVAGIDAEQTTSIALHGKFGFVQAAHLKQVGYKFGRWLDVVYMQLMLER